MEVRQLTAAKTYIVLASFALFAFRASLFAAVQDGYIVKVESSTVYLDWGKSSGVQVGDQFKVYRPGESLKHPITGEILGQTQEDLGQGVVDHLEEKFSTGKLIETKDVIKPGDRTQRSDVPAAPALTVTDSTPTVALPKEIWRSAPIPSEAVGLAVGDVVGDRKKDVVVAFRDHIEVFQWNGQKLESIAAFKGHGYGNYLAVETADIEAAGHDKIFATLFIEGVRRSRTVVLELSSGTLREVGHVEGFVRAFEHTDGKHDLLWQSLSLARELHVLQPAPLTKDGKSYHEGKPLKLNRSLEANQLFGFSWGDWDGDGAEDFALLHNGDSLRIFFKDAQWSSDETYGGSKADFSWNDNQVGSVYPRLLNWKSSAGQTQLLVPHNIPTSALLLTHLKIYKNSEIIDLAWNGAAMAPLWTLPISGELADFGIGDGLGRGASQLWVAAVGPGDKTILISYQLP